VKSSYVTPAKLFNLRQTCRWSICSGITCSESSELQQRLTGNFKQLKISIMHLHLNEIEIIKDLFYEIQLPIEVFANNVHVNQNSRNGKELELVIRSKNLNPLPAEMLTKLCDKVRNSNISIKVEIKDWLKIPINIQNKIVKEYVLLFESPMNFDNPKNIEEPLVNIYNNTNTIRFFNSFEESEDYLRLKMAKMTPEERLIQLKKIRAISGRLAPANHSSELNLLTIKIEIGVTK